MTNEQQNGAFEALQGKIVAGINSKIRGDTEWGEAQRVEALIWAWEALPELLESAESIPALIDAIVKRAVRRQYRQWGVETPKMDWMTKADCAEFCLDAQYLYHGDSMEGESMVPLNWFCRNIHPRLADCALMLADGFTQTEIARVMGLSTSTISRTVIDVGREYQHYQQEYQQALTEAQA